MAENLVQQLTKELTAQTERAQALQQIVDELFTIASPGAIKNALWARYQGIEGASPEESEDEEPPDLVVEMHNVTSDPDEDDPYYVHPEDR